MYKSTLVWPQQCVLQPYPCLITRFLLGLHEQRSLKRHLHWGILFQPSCHRPCVLLAWSRHGARSPLFSFACCCAHFLATYQLQTVTCCRDLVLLRLARQKEELGMQCISEVFGFVLFVFFLILEAEMQTMS